MLTDEPEKSDIFGFQPLFAQNLKGEDGVIKTPKTMKTLNPKDGLAARRKTIASNMFWPGALALTTALCANIACHAQTGKSDSSHVDAGRRFEVSSALQRGPLKPIIVPYSYKPISSDTLKIPRHFSFEQQFINPPLRAPRRTTQTNPSYISSSE